MAALIIGLIFVAVLMGVYHVIFRERALRGAVLSRSKKTRALFVTAHPDDECMFFAPTILSLTTWAKYEVFILCMSKGNYAKQGHLREKELYDSCTQLGIKRSNVLLVDDRRLPDDPEINWSAKLISETVLQQVLKYKINLVFTFDGKGVSGHPNHKALYAGIRSLLNDDECPEELHAFKLITTNIIRKYISVMDTFFSYFTAKLIFTSPWLQVWKAQQAMYAHYSQFTWFRILYIMFSRYMIINTYDVIEPPLDFDKG